MVSCVEGSGHLCIAEWLVVEGVCSYEEGESLVVYRGVVSCGQLCTGNGQKYRGSGQLCRDNG